MDIKALLKTAGSLDQIAYARKSVLTEGKADGMKVIDIANSSGLAMTLLESRCLDIAQLSYRGININYMCKAGWVSPQNYSSVENNYNEYFHGGMLYTCGLENFGPKCLKNEKVLPIHGTIGLTPAEEVNCSMDWDSEEIRIKGVMRKSALFGKNITLERNITIPIFESRIYIDDTVTNLGFSDEDIMLLYHFNFGYPMLGEDTELLINEYGVEPRDENAKKGVDRWNTFEAPTDNRPEEVFFHRPKNENDDKAHARIENKALNIGSEIVYDKEQLPQLVQWKSMRSGDYALGVEPATSLGGGYAVEKEEGRVITLSPGEKREFNLSLGFYDLK